MSYLFCAAILLCGMSIYASCYSRTKDLLNPFGISSIIWCVVSGFAALKLSYVQQSWTGEMYIIIFLFPITILVSSYVKIPVKADKPININFTNMYIFFSRFVFLVSILCAVFEWRQQDYGMTLLEGGFFDVKSGWTAATFFHYGTILLPYCAIFAFFELCYRKDKNKLECIFLILIIFAHLFYSIFLAVSRGDLIISFLGGLYILLRCYHISIKKIAAMLLILLIGLIFIASIRINEASMVFNIVRGHPYISAVYSYTALNLENLNKLVNAGSSYSLFGRTFGGFLQLFGLESLGNFTAKWQTYFFNATPLCYGFYDDLGLLGVVLYTFILYAVINVLYTKSRYDIRYILIIAVLQKAIYCVFFGNYFTEYRVIIFPYIVTCLLIWTLKFKVTVNSKGFVKNLRKIKRDNYDKKQIYHPGK